MRHGVGRVADRRSSVRVADRRPAIDGSPPAGGAFRPSWRSSIACDRHPTERGLPDGLALASPRAVARAPQGSAPSPFLAATLSPGSSRSHLATARSHRPVRGCLARLGRPPPFDLDSARWPAPWRTHAARPWNGAGASGDPQGERRRHQQRAPREERATIRPPVQVERAAVSGLERRRGAHPG